MELYRIYTENKNLKGIRKILDSKLEGYTIFKGLGIWQRIKEKSLTVEIVSEKSFNVFEEIATRIKILNHQQAVLVTVSEIESKLI